MRSVIGASAELSASWWNGRHAAFRPQCASMSVRVRPRLPNCCGRSGDRPGLISQVSRGQHPSPLPLSCSGSSGRRQPSDKRRERGSTPRGRTNSGMCMRMRLSLARRSCGCDSRRLHQLHTAMQSVERSAFQAEPRGFESLAVYQSACTYRLAARITRSQRGDRGSSPRRCTNFRCALSSEAERLSYKQRVRGASP